MIALAAGLLLSVAVQVQVPRTLSVRRDLLVDPATADLSAVLFNVAVSPRGDILVGQANDGLIKVFSPVGVVSTVGRKGEGPGEFRRVTRIGFKQDSLWTFDPALSRVSVFSPGYKFVRSFAEPVSKEVGVSRLWPQALLPNGDLRAAVSFIPTLRRPAWAARADSGTTMLVRVSAAGAIRKPIGFFPRSHCQVSRAVGSLITNMAIPFCPERLSTESFATAGFAFVEVSDESFRVTSIGANDDTLFVKVFPFAPIAVTKGALDTLREREQEIRKISSAASWAARPVVVPARTYPPVRRVVLGRDNTVWLELRTESGGHRWLALDPRGISLGTVLLPDGVSLEVAERGTLWGLVTDDDGLRGVVRYRVTGY
ncbi:MAG: hypothetical protein V4558_12305 [Gemmatimonadota bacterium]